MSYLRTLIQRRSKEGDMQTLVFDLYDTAHQASQPSIVRVNMLRLLQKRLPDIFAPRNGGIAKGTPKVGMKG